MSSLLSFFAPGKFPLPTTEHFCQDNWRRTSLVLLTPAGALYVTMRHSCPWSFLQSTVPVPLNQLPQLMQLTLKCKVHAHIPRHPCLWPWPPKRGCGMIEMNEWSKILACTHFEEEGLESVVKVFWNHRKMPWRQFLYQNHVLMHWWGSLLRAKQHVVNSVH